MNSSNPQDIALSTGRGPDAISDDVALILLLSLDSLKLVLSILSSVLNGFNIFIFCMMGTMDSVSISLLSLSLADFTTVALYSVASANEIFQRVGFPWASDIYTYVLSLVFSMTTDYATAVTTYIALQRALCVALPFLVRHLFNRNKSFIVVLALFVFFIGCWLPRYTTFYITRKPDPANNSSSILVVNLMDKYSQFNSFFHFFRKGVLVNVEYAVMIICTGVIAVGMRSSIKLKQTSFSTESTPDPQQKQTKHTPEKADSKEVRVIKQTLTVVVVNVVFTLPTIAVSVYMVFEPRLQYGAQFNNLYFVAFAITNTCYTINTIANYFIYLKYNSKFKERVQKFWSKRSEPAR